MNTITLKHLQGLFIAIVATAMISPPLANLFEVLLVVGLFLGQSVKDHTKTYMATRDFKIHLGFVLLLLVGIAYPMTDTPTYLASLLSWRKFLLLPIGCVLFGNTSTEREKGLRSLFYFILFLLTLAIIYKTGWLPFFKMDVIKFEIGTTSSEGMFVSVAMAIGLTALLNPPRLLALPKALGALLVAIPVGYIAFMTTGRSGYVAMLIVLLVMSVHYFLRKTKTNRLAMGMGILLVLGASALLLLNSATSSARIQQAWTEFNHSETNANNNVNTSIGQRMIFWKNTIEMVPHHYMWGVGTGNFQAAYAKQVQDKTGMEASVTQDPHNQYMKILIEQGILGLFLFLWMVGRSLFQKTQDEGIHTLAFSVLAIWVVTSCFNAHFTTFMEGTFIWAWMGLMHKHKP